MSPGEVFSLKKKAPYLELKNLGFTVVIMGKQFNLSEPQFSHVLNGLIIIIFVLIT